MAKLSNLKKVELLEQTVLKKDIDEVKRILKEEAPIEFTARAIGLACRFVGPQMVEALLDGGASLSFANLTTLSPFIRVSILNGVLLMNCILGTV